MATVQDISHLLHVILLPEGFGSSRLTETKLTPLPDEDDFGRRCLGPFSDHDVLSYLTAAQTGDMTMLQEFLAKGMPVDALCLMFGETGLSKACRMGELEAARLLCDSGADINMRTGRYMETPLFVAVRNGRVDIIQFLLERGADLDLGDSRDRKPLMLTASMGNPELMKLLISKGCNLNAFDWRGMFALHHCFFGYQGQYITSSVTLECVQVLVEAGADMNTPSTDGWTALNLAVGRRLKQVIKYLLLQNCDPGRKGMSVVGEPEKRVPLYTAVLNKDMQTMKMLLLAGSSCCGSSDIKKTLKEASADQAEFDAIWALLCQPRSFKESCRVAVRDKLRECDSSGGTRFPQRVESLEIPRALKDFVLLKELEDM